MKRNSCLGKTIIDKEELMAKPAIFAIPLFGSNQCCWHVKTENPIEEIWSMLLMFSDRIFLERFWAGKSDDDYLTATKTLVQAREYYLASKTVTLNTRPLLLYYSILNLTKAVLLILGEETPQEYHGLCKPDFGCDFLESKASVNNGVFLSLAKKENYSVDIKTEFSIEYMIKSSIDLYNAYEYYYKREAPIIKFTEEKYRDGNIYLKSTASKSKIELITQFFKERKALDDKFEIDIDGNLICLKNKEVLKLSNAEELLDEMQLLLSEEFSFSVFNSESVYLILEKNPLPPAAAYFGISYMLGMLVRYSPSRYYHFIENPTSSQTWFVKKVCDTIERVYPNIMLNYIYRDCYKFY